MVAAEDGDAVPVAELHRDEEGDGLDGVVSSVDVVTHEEVVRVRGVATDAEEFGEVVLRGALAMLNSDDTERRK